MQPCAADYGTIERTNGMNQMQQCSLGNGVFFTHVPAGQFKTSVLSLNFFAPLCRETAAEHALLFPVLKRGSVNYPDMQAVTACLDSIYGGSLYARTRRFGEAQCFGLLSQVTGDRYTLDGSAPAPKALELMFDLLLHPVLEGDGFRADYVESEKENLLDQIRGELNDKRDYAYKQLVRAMCAEEPYGVSSSGDLDTVAAITPQQLYARYQSLLQSAPIEIFYCGDTDFETMKAALLPQIAKLPARNVSALPPIVIGQAPAQTNLVREHLDVAQGKLSLGFRAQHEDKAAMMLCNAMYGGSLTSKLFMQVREALSLCYYASSSYDRQKEVILVSTGIEFSKYETAKNEILKQLTLLRDGKFDEQEFRGAKSYLINALRSYADSQLMLENHWVGQSVSDAPISPEELAQQLERVTQQQVRDAAAAVQLDTIYFLDGKEA